MTRIGWGKGAKQNSEGRAENFEEQRVKFDGLGACAVYPYV
jgi:hypothetical protein